MHEVKGKLFFFFKKKYIFLLISIIGPIDPIDPIGNFTKLDTIIVTILSTILGTH